jgi:hypothetical protein
MLSILDRLETIVEEKLWDNSLFFEDEEMVARRLTTWEDNAL